MTVAALTLQDAFTDRFGAPPQWIVRAPGRVNIIGEHTDYNEGFVLPMAIDRNTTLAARPRHDRRLRVYSETLDAEAEADLEHIARSSEAPWIDYILGVAQELTELGHTPTGADVWVRGDIPLGAGLSSSASFEMAACLMFERLGGFSLEGPEAAKLGRRVENGFLGLSSGIMDQFVSRMARRDHALFLDCRTLDYRHIPLRFDTMRFVIANTNTPHRLTSSKYNERVRECRDAVHALNTITGATRSHLRDFSRDDIEAARHVLGDVLYRRARHVITENERTQEACAAMEAGDAVALGRLMDASHESLRRDYEVTYDAAESDVDHLTVMANLARQLPGCLGARMTGGGFGGSTINLVDANHVEAFCGALMEAYTAQTGLEGSVIVSDPAPGAEAYPIDGH